MKQKFGIFLMIIGLMFAAGCGASNASSANGNSTDSTEDDRIVATTVALVEIMDELELDLVGVPTSYKDLPERYADATEVGMAAEPDLEIIRSLKPTNVLSATTLDAEFDLAPTFEQADIPVTFVDMESLEGMYEAILDLGEKYDRTEQAESIVQASEDTFAEIEAKVADKESPTVLILLGVPGSYLVATENSYVGDLVKRAGGENAIQDEDVEFVASNTENLQQSNPDIILRMAHGMPDEVVEMFDEEFEESDIWKHFKAVQNDRVYDLEETRFGTTANLAATEAMKELVEILYPEDS